MTHRQTTYVPAEYYVPDQIVICVGLLVSQERRLPRRRGFF